ncbi:MAG: MBL fold metallo-hydrolase, partial [Chloroflexi bacterium]|nr:MBL fold metallo-hydrolase [Chloroflexota bacterium]
MPARHAARDDAWRAVRAASPGDTAGPKRARLTFLGHSTVLIEVDDLRILTDPVLRRGLGPVRRQVQAVLPEL